ncbi:MAG: CYTH and CHAD domain-containing protein [Actinomycetota bacterium]
MSRTPEPEPSMEREAKLQAPPGFRLPELGGDGLIATVRPERRYATTYLDTGQLHLARWGCSLRYREGQGWTAKLPSREVGDLLVRREYVFDGPAPPRRAPEAAVDLLRAYVRDRPLGPSARLRTLRRSVQLTDDLGRPVAEVTDDEVSVMHGRRVASRFRELEIELAPGAPEEAVAGLLERLHDAGAGPVENVPKIRRALGPRADAAPEVAVRPVGSHATVSEVVRGALAASTARLFNHDAGVRVGLDPEDVHQARVATRRLRSDLRTFRDFVEPDWATALREELRWLGAELGAVRDVEVLRERLRGRVGSLPPSDRRAADGLIDSLDRRHDAVREELLAAMREPRYLRLLDALVVAADAPALLEGVADAPAAEAFRPALESPWKHLVTAMDAVAADATDENLHAARIRAKRVRYAAEAVAAVFGKRARAFAEAAVAVQDVLGEHQDAVVAGAWLREAAAEGGDAFVAGELAAIESQAAARAREGWPGAWKGLSRKRLRFWA